MFLCWNGAETSWNDAGSCDVKTTDKRGTTDDSNYLSACNLYIFCDFPSSVKDYVMLISYILKVAILN